MSDMRRVKAVFWWYCLHKESRRAVRGVLVSMQTDADTDLLYKTYSVAPKREDGGRSEATGS